MSTTATVTFPMQVVGTWTLASSLIHGGDETLGTTKLFRTKGIVYEGRRVRIPVVSGNAIRAIWRRHCAFAFLDAYLAAGGEPIELSAFYYLTSGGSLKKGTAGRNSGVLDLAGERALRALIPYAGLFGGSALGRMQPGKLWVDEGMPVCVETLPILRQLDPSVEEAATAGMSIRDLREVHGYSRQDDAKNEHLRRYLSAAAVAEVEAKAERAETDETAQDAGTPQQMRYEQEELIMGTVISHRWGFLLRPTERELMGLAAGLLRWAERPVVGGRSAVGHGRILPRYRGVTPETRLLGDGSHPLEEIQRQSVDDALAEHVAANLDPITSLLRAL